MTKNRASNRSISWRPRRAQPPTRGCWRRSTPYASSTSCRGATAIRADCSQIASAPPTPPRRYTGVGGNVPQTLVNQACLDIQSGRADLVLIAGAETFRTRTRLRARGIEAALDESRRIGAVRRGRQRKPAAGRARQRSASTLLRPAHVYPLFEQALRIDAGESSDDHRRRIGELWSQIQRCGAGQPACLEPSTAVGRGDLAAE